MAFGTNAEVAEKSIQGLLAIVLGALFLIITTLIVDIFGITAAITFMGCCLIVTLAILLYILRGAGGF